MLLSGYVMVRDPAWPLLLGHSVKNTGGQVSSCGKTVHMGLLYVEMAACRSFGMPISAYTRADAQSDGLQALLASPYFMVPEVAENIELQAIPWCTRGALVWSVSVAMVQACSFHKGLSATERLEAAVAGFIIWDLWSVMSARLEAERGARTGSFSMAPETTQNLQSISLGIISMLLTHEDPGLTFGELFDAICIYLLGNGFAFWCLFFNDNHIPPHTTTTYHRRRHHRPPPPKNTTTILVFFVCLDSGWFWDILGIVWICLDLLGDLAILFYHGCRKAWLRGTMDLPGYPNGASKVASVNCGGRCRTGNWMHVPFAARVPPGLSRASVKHCRILRSLRTRRWPHPPQLSRTSSALKDG